MKKITILFVLAVSATTVFAAEQASQQVTKAEEGQNVRPLSALHAAALKGDVDAIRQLLASGVSVDLLDAEKQTPLYWAAYEGQDEAAKVLLQKGANPTLENSDGRSPIKAARLRGHLRLQRAMQEWWNKNKPTNPL